jgi:hypothetical protein
LNDCLAGNNAAIELLLRCVRLQGKSHSGTITILFVIISRSELKGATTLRRRTVASAAGNKKVE